MESVIFTKLKKKKNWGGSIFDGRAGMIIYQLIGHIFFFFSKQIPTTLCSHPRTFPEAFRTKTNNASQEKGIVN
jgi:hypothetical protein